MKKYSNKELKVDIVLLSIIENELKVFLLKRSDNPYKDKWSLAGGYIPKEMDAYQAAHHQLKIKTGLTCSNLRLVDVFSNPDRDPTGNIASCAFMTLVNSNEMKTIKTKFASEYKWENVNKIKDLAYDHKDIIQKAKKMLEKDIRTTKMGFELVTKEFTIKELIKTFEAVTNKKLDQSNVRKKMKKLDLLISTDNIKKEGAGRPSPIFKLNLQSYKKLDEFETLFN